MSNSKEVMEKIIKQLKNEGVFGDLVKRAVADLEEEGFFETLREEGKEKSDAIFRRHFPNREVVVDMTDRKLKEDIMSATKNYATRPELQQRIENKLKDTFKYDWIWSLGYNQVEDKVLHELGLEPVIRPSDIKEEETESVEREAAAEQSTEERGDSVAIEINEEDKEEDMSGVEDTAEQSEETIDT